MPAVFYNVLHIAGIIGVFFALGGIFFHAANGGTKEGSWRRGVAIMHGVGLVIIFVSGFGLLAKLKIPFEGWVYAKLFIWFLLGGLLAVPYRFPQYSKLMFWLVPLIGAVAAYLARYKPF